MNPEEIRQLITDVGLIVTMVIGLSGLYWTWRNSKRALVKTDIETGQQAILSMNEALSLAKEASAQVSSVRKEMREMQVNYDLEIESLKKDNEEYKYQIQLRDLQIEGLKDWSERLINQLHSIDQKAIPVTMKPIKEPPRRGV